MTALLAWVGLPLVLGALAYGCGGLVEVAAARRLSFAERVGAGGAALLALAPLPALVPGAALLSLPLLLAAAVAGVALAPPAFARPSRETGAALAAAVSVFALLALPILLSGRATFA